MSPLLDLEDATLVVGKQRFGPFSLQVAAGERIAVLGPSGAGKSTLLKLLSGERLAAEGQVQFLGLAMADWPLAALSQQRAVLPQAGDVAFGLQTELVIGLGRVARTHDPQRARIVEEAARLAHAGHLLGRRFDTLSGGEQARVHLARIFAQLWDRQQGLVLVDEPLAALDPGLQCELLDSLDRYASARQHALVAILHDINQALAGFDRLLLIRQGRLVGDLPATASALPALEALYDVSLRCFTDGHGAWVVAPLRPPRGLGPAPALAGEAWA